LTILRLRTSVLCSFSLIGSLYLSSIPFSREQHNIFDNDGVPVSLQS
jgi:hypothetical protein